MMLSPDVTVKMAGALAVEGVGLTPLVKTASYS